MDIPTPEEVRSTLSKREQDDVLDICGYIGICLRQYDGSEMAVTLDNTNHSRVKNEVAKRVAAKGWEIKWGVGNQPNNAGQRDIAYISAAKPPPYVDQRDSISGGQQEDR